jgi:hypothetical protein
MYASQRDVGVISAVSTDGGLSFVKEEGVRVAVGAVPHSAAGAFAPEVLVIPGGRYRMYYVGVSGEVKGGAPSRCTILTATSDDGLRWELGSDPVIVPTAGGGRGGAVAGAGGCTVDHSKCSEMSVIPLVGGGFRMFYEACDGTAPGERGVWRIATAVSAPAVEGAAGKQPSSGSDAFQ